MSRRAREVETIVLTMLAALPLYATNAVSTIGLVIFHTLMAAMAIRVAAGRSPEILSRPVLNAAAVGYFIFYFVDWLALSHNLIAASSHLVLFIAVYQPMEAMTTRNQGQRLLITALIFVSSLATSTHIAIVLFVLVFAFMMLRQLMYLSHLATVQALDRPFNEPPSGRAASFYVLATAAVALLLFPILPRIRNPLVHGITGDISNASTGLSESINFNEARSITSDGTAVARVWLGPEAVPFFAPLRMRAVVYDRWASNEWQQSLHRNYVPLKPKSDGYRVAVPHGVTRVATIQQRFVFGSRLFLPTGTYRVAGVPQLLEGPTQDVFSTWSPTRDKLQYEVGLATQPTPLRTDAPKLMNYPVTPAVAAMARGIVGESTSTIAQSAKIESWMSRNFKYVPDPASLGKRPVSVDEFLLRTHRGHCEYFAAGMVALLTSRGIPARIIGGFYGGELNPLTGYFVIRKQDAHAWVEVWDAGKWLTFDPTPAALRPGNAANGLLKAYASALNDSVNYFWDRYVLTFGLGDQIALAADLIARVREGSATIGQHARDSVNEIFSRRYAIVLAVLLGACFLALALRRSRRPIHEELTAALARAGIEVGPAMTMEEALTKARVSTPAIAVALAPLVALYEEERFSEILDKRRKATIRRGLAALRS